MAEPKPSVAELLAQYEESRPKALDERFTQPVPPEAGPFQQIIPEEETYRDMAERNLAGMLGDDRQAFRRAGKLLDTADQLPILGDASAGIDVVQAIKDVDPVGIGIGALGMIPGVNRAAVRENVRNFFNRKTPDERALEARLALNIDPEAPELKERLLRAQNMGFDISKPYYHGTSDANMETIVNLDQPQGIEKFLGRGEEVVRPSVYLPEENKKLKSQGTFFSASPDISSTYAVGKEGSVNYPVFLNKTEYLRFKASSVDDLGQPVSKGGKPSHFSQVPLKNMVVEFPDGRTAKVEKAFPNLQRMIAPSRKDSRKKSGTVLTDAHFLAEIAKDAGYKGMILENTMDIGAGRSLAPNPKKLEEAHDVVVVIDPSTVRSVNAEFDPAAKDSAEILKAKGGMVTNMNRPVMSRGLSNLIRNYSQGPLARLDVPRETVPVQGMFEGGMPRNFDPFATDREPTEREEEVRAQLAAEALADDAPLPPIPLNQAQQKAYRAGLLQMDDLGYGRPENNEFLYVGDTGIPAGTTTTTVLPQEQGTSGAGDTSPIEDGPGGPPIEETITDAPLSDPTVPYTMPEVVEETTEQQTTTTQPTTQTTTTQPTQQTTTTTTQQPQQPVGTGRTPDQVMADRAAEEAAAAEAERIRLANLAAQEQLAAEQLAAQQQVTQDNVVPVLGEEPTAAQTLDQELAQELADQATTQLAAQQNLDSQVLGAEQLVDQQAADRALLEAQLTNQDDPTAVFQAPPPDTVDRGSFGVPPAISTQAVDPNAPNFLVADKIDPYTTGYAPTLGMNIKETVYPYQGMTQEEMEEQGVYRGQVFQPMPKLTFGSGGEDAGQSQGELVPKLEFGSQKQTGKGRYVTNPVTGAQIWVPDYSDTRGPANLDTRNAESQVGEYGLGDEQQYQCPGYYTLAFEGGQPYCKKVDKSQWPSGGQQRLRVSKLPSRTAVQIIELKEPGGETREGYAQGGPVQNFSLGGMALHQAQMAAMRRAAQGPFGQALFQRFQNTGFVPPPQQQNMQMLQQQQMPQQPRPGFVPQGVGVAQPMPNRLQTLIPDGPPPGSIDTAPMDRLARGDIRTRGPESFGQMGPPQRMGQISRLPSPPPQQIGQVAEPDTQQLASQLQNVTQQVNQLSSHLGVSGGGQQRMAQGPSQYQPGGLQGGIGGLLSNLRPTLPPQQLAQTGPVRPPMLQMRMLR
jgi:hypothetical protein